jgi:hypothetical protein
MHREKMFGLGRPRALDRNAKVRIMRLCGRQALVQPGPEGGLATSARTEVCAGRSEPMTASFLALRAAPNCRPIEIAVACERAGNGIAPSLPPVKACSTVSVGVNPNTTPAYEAPPPPAVVP